LGALRKGCARPGLSGVLVVRGSSGRRMWEPWLGAAWHRPLLCRTPGARVPRDCRGDVGLWPGL